MNITTPSGVEIVFDDDKHAYRIDGERLPSVTTVLGCVDKSGALLPWAERITLEGLQTLLESDDGLVSQGSLKDTLEAHGLRYTQLRDNRATSGTSVHDALEVLAKDGTPPRLSAFPEEDRGFVQGLAKWWLKHRPETLMTEQLVASKQFRFAGKFDLLCKIDGRVHLCDLKTGKAIYNVAHAQVQAYAMALEECGWDPPDVCSILRVDKDGGYEFVESTATRKDFLAIREMYEVLKRLNRKPKIREAA